jgi:hypothetical protein
MSSDGKRDWITIGSLAIVGASAAITSFSAQADLAAQAGWPGLMSWLLPATDDVYGIAATRIWLSASSGPELKKHARAHAFAALLLSMAGNAMDHALKSGALKMGPYLWLLVVAVSLVPPIALGALMHLVTLRGRTEAVPADVTVPAKPLPDRATEPRTVPSAKPAPGGSVQPSRAITVPAPSQATVPTVPPTKPLTEPAKTATVPSTEPVPSGTVPGDRANQAITESDSGEQVPPEIRVGVTAPDYVLDAARTIYGNALDNSQKMTDRKLATATRDHFKVGYPVIGRSACQTIITEVERDEATG